MNRMFRTAAPIVVLVMALTAAPLWSADAAPRATRQKRALLQREYDRLAAQARRLAEQRARLLNIMAAIRYSAAVTQHDRARLKRQIKRLRRGAEIVDFFVSSDATSFMAGRNKRGTLNPAGTTVWLHLRFTSLSVYRRTPYTVRFDLLDGVTGTRRYGSYGPTTRTVTRAEEKVALTLGRFRVTAGRYTLRATVRVGRQVLKKNVYVVLKPGFLIMQNRIMGGPTYPGPAPAARKKSRPIPRTPGTPRTPPPAPEVDPYRD